MMGLFRSVSGVGIGTDISCGVEFMLLDDDGVDGPESTPRMSSSNVATVCRLCAKFMKELKRASCISRLGSLCIFVFELLTRAALAQQNIGWENDIILGAMEG